MKLNRIKKLYVAQYNESFKIGVTNNVKNRMKQLSCGCPTIKCIYESNFLSNAFDIETILHNKYKDKNIGGEWFYNIEIEEVKNIVKEMGKSVDYEKFKEKEMKKFSFDLEKCCNKFFPAFTSYENKDDRDMSAEELQYENEQISKFSIAVSGADVPNIYSDLIYNLLFGKDTRQMIKTYKTSEFESFRKYLSQKQNATIKKYTNIIGDMINAYWAFDKIKDYMETI